MPLLLISVETFKKSQHPAVLEKQTYQHRANIHEPERKIG